MFRSPGVLFSLDPDKWFSFPITAIESAQKFAEEMQSQLPARIEPVEVAQAAVRGADIIVTATTGRDPVLKREWISPGAHINAIGTFSPKAREIDTATMVAASLFVDCRESALNEVGDYLIAAKEGAIALNTFGLGWEKF